MRPPLQWIDDATEADFVASTGPIRAVAHNSLAGKWNNADVWQATATLGRANRDLPDDLRQQRMYIDEWFHHSAVRVRHVLGSTLSDSG